MTVAAPRRGSCLVLAAGVIVLGCGNEEAPPPARARSPGCIAPAGVSSQPEDIEQTVALVNALPKPLTLPCFLESLARPVRLFASRSLVSAQPATGLRSPRLFLFVGANVMTVVPEGEGSHLLELGEQRPDFRSLKAEIAFPVSAELEPHAPFSRVMFDEQLTSCAFCHAAEEEEAGASVRGFSSVALRPRDGERVSPESVLREHLECDAAIEPERCALLDALFGWGPVQEQTFPPEMRTFGN